MKAHFLLQVNHKGEKVDIKGKFKEGRFDYNLIFKLDDCEVTLEPDVNSKYNIIVKPAKLLKEGKVDMELINVIKTMLEDA